MANHEAQKAFAKRINEEAKPDKAYEEHVQRVKAKIAAHKGYGLPRTSEGKEKSDGR